MIYTALSGNKDAPRDDIPCFTDYEKFLNPARNAKIAKILPHLFMQTEWSIWVDANIHLKVPAEVLLEKLGDAEIGVFPHPDRKCLYDEAQKCIEWKKDDPATIKNQVERYIQEGFPENSGLAACGVLVRKHTEKINRLNERWWAEICRGSVRDQISFPYVYRDSIKYFEPVNLWDNQYFYRHGHIK